MGQRVDAYDADHRHALYLMVRSTNPDYELEARCLGYFTDDASVVRVSDLIQQKHKDRHMYSRVLVSANEPRARYFDSSGNPMGARVAADTIAVIKPFDA